MRRMSQSHHDKEIRFAFDVKGMRADYLLSYANATENWKCCFQDKKMDEKYSLLCPSVTVEEKCLENTERKLDMEARMRHHRKKSKIDHKRKLKSGNPHRWRRYMSGGWRQYLEARKTFVGGNIWT